MKKSTLLLMVLCMLTIQLSAQHKNPEKEKESAQQAARPSTTSIENLITQKSNLYVVTNENVSKKSGIRHVYLRQAINGLEVYGTESSVHFDKAGKVLTEHNNFLADVQATLKNSSQGIDARAAIAAVANQMGYKVSNLQEIKSIGGRNKAAVFNKADISLVDIPVKLMYYFREGIGTQLVWELSIAEKTSTDWWNFRVDAVTGRIIDKENWTVSCNIMDGHNEHFHGEEAIPIPTIVGPLNENEAAKKYSKASKSIVSEVAPALVGGYRVYAMPTESPNHGPRTLQNNPDNATASPFGWHDTNGVAGPESTLTTGNNVDAHKGSDRPNGTAALIFDFIIDLNQNPASNTAPYITNLFYWNNITHDVLYQYGFDEASGNFQENNYGNGGAGSDGVNANAQASGNCNANFGTPADGSNPTMNMFLCNNSTPSHDGDLDAGVIVHEYGHGVSNRLTGGPSNVGCLNNQEQMGEGWSDIYGLILTIEPGDTGTDARGVGTYLLGQPITGNGVRTQRYSTDFAVNNHTYDDIITAVAPHGVGEVWATMLWDMTWGIIGTDGFDPDVYNGTAGNNVSLALITEGLKLQPCSPGFVDGRDAIIAADQALYGGAHICTIWEAFARRGLGYSANQGSSGSKTDGTEAFDLPPSFSSLDTIDEVCLSDGIQTGLSGGNPNGGVYSGAGVTDDGNGMTYTFDPTVGGPGLVTITYTVNDFCTGTPTAITDDINVTNDPPEIVCMGTGNVPMTGSQSSSPGTAIPDNNPTGVTVTMNVTEDVSITDLDVNLNISHTFVGDLIITIKSPTGTMATIVDRIGAPPGTFGCSGNDILATLDDEAATPVENECAGAVPTINGSFTPNNTLSIFDGESTMGLWELTVSDNAAADTGTINSWGIDYDYEVTAPVLDVTLDGSGNATVNAEDLLFSVAVDCGGYTVLAGSPLAATVSFSCSDVGMNTVNVEVTNDSGATSTCSAIVNVIGSGGGGPFTCPGDITQDNDPGICGAVVTYTVDSPSGCGGAGTLSQTAGLPSGSTFPVGTTTNTFEYDDGINPVQTCSFDITINDAEVPVITCPGDITVDNDPGVCGALVNYTVTTSDNCSSGSSSSITYTYTGSVETFTVPPGVTSISIEAWGASGQDFTVEQYTPSTGGLGGYSSGDLTVTPGDVISIYVGGAGADNTPGYNGGSLGGYGTPSDGWAGRAGSGGGASDVRIGAATLTDRVLVAGGGGGGGRDYVNGSCQPCGMGGNGGDGGALIGIDGQDPTDPIYGFYFNPGAAGKGGTQATGGAGGDGPQGPNGMPGVLGVGGIGNDGVYSIASGGGGGGYYGGGSGAGADSGSGAAGAGGAGGSSYIDGVNNGVTMAGVRSGDGEIVISYESLILTQTAGLPSGSTFPVGTTTNTFVVTDGAGNTATCSFDVIVNDTEAPAITCPGNITQDNDPGICGAVITYTAPVGTDNCSGSTTAQTAGLASGSTFPVGTTTNTFVVTDASGNTATCSFDVTINDNEAPVANCAAPFNLQLDVNGMASITAADIDNGSTDNCAIASLSVSPSSFTCADVGTNNVVLTVTDVNGNTSTCTAVVTVEDNVAPTAVCQNITVFLDATGNVSIVAGDVDGGSTDACGIASTSIDITDFTCADLGPNNVILTVTDVNGNTSTCTAVVTVEDDIPPTIACPADITVNTDAGLCSAVVTFPMPLVLDNCTATATQTGGLASGSDFPVGVNTVEFTATDGSGNTAVCSFTITVVDNEAPTMVCQNITIQLDEFGNATITAADVDGGSTDNCGIAAISVSPSTFDCSDVGDNPVVLTVTDIHGNSNTCTAIVTVEDVTPPVAVCQNITVELDPVTGTVTITGADVDGGSTDACGIDTYSLDIDTFDCSNIGDNTVVLTVTDVNGNVSTCTAIVTVEDNTNPELVCQDFTIEIGADGTATLSPSDVIASNDDACGILTVAVDITEFSCADIGTPVTVQVFSQDNNGNLSTCTAVVTAVDLLAPELTCPADQIIDPGAGNLFYIVPDYFATGEATAIDNCTDPVTITTQSPAAGTPLSDGVYTITLTAEDEYGNVSTCTFELTIESVLGVGNYNNDFGSLQMYPNPAKNTVTIGNPQSLSLEKLSIFDLRGRMVKSIDLRSMGTQKTIDVSEMAAATYLVIIQGENGQTTKRLIKE